MDSWDHTWEHASIDAALRWVPISHLRPIFDRYFPKPGKILEGGCGLGHFVIYYRRLGYDIEGVDFSPLAIARLKAYDLTLPVQLGDVTDLPYPDASIQCYYSGGVVEHFEDGPFVALKEARRVLSADGWLLITVPFLNAVRRLKALLGISRRLWGSDPAVLLSRRQFIREASPIRGHHFAEYAFGSAEFARILEDSGFRVEAVHPCDVEWGEICQFLYRRFRRSTHVPAAAGQLATTVVPSQGGDGSGGSMFRAFWKEFFVTEHPRQRWLRPVVRSLTHISGHMVLFACRPLK